MTWAKIALTGGPTGSQTRLEIDGTDISHRVQSVTVEVGVDQVMTATVEYHCQEVVIDGDVHVVHVCPVVGPE